jgi:hypothetical protein
MTSNPMDHARKSDYSQDFHPHIQVVKNDNHAMALKSGRKNLNKTNF